MENELERKAVNLRISKLRVFFALKPKYGSTVMGNGDKQLAEGSHECRTEDHHSKRLNLSCPLISQLFNILLTPLCRKQLRNSHDVIVLQDQHQPCMCSWSSTTNLKNSSVPFG